MNLGSHAVCTCSRLTRMNGVGLLFESYFEHNTVQFSMQDTGMSGMRARLIPRLYCITPPTSISNTIKPVNEARWVST